MKTVPSAIQLRSLMASSTLFRRVIRTCEFLKGAKLDEATDYTIKACIVVTYMTPFGHGKGFEKLGDEYTSFPDRADLKALHLSLEASRNCIFAHHGPKQARELIKEPALLHEFDNIRLRLKTRPVSETEMEFEFTYTVQGVSLSDVNLPKIIELCQYHEDHVKRDLNALIKVNYENNIYPDGDYIFGKDFPSKKKSTEPR